MIKNLRHSREDHLHKPGKVVVQVSIPVAHQIGQVMDSRSRREPLPSGSDQKDNHIAKIGDYRRCQNVSMSKAAVHGLLCQMPWQSPSTMCLLTCCLVCFQCRVTPAGVD